MHSLALTSVVALLATTALAAPTPNQELTKRSFTVPRVRKSSAVRAPAQELARVFRKYNWSSSDVVVSERDLPKFHSDDDSSPPPPSWGAAATHHHHHHLTTTTLVVSASPAPATSASASASAATTAPASSAPASSAPASSAAPSSSSAASSAAASSTAASATVNAPSSGSTGSVAANSVDNGSEYVSPVSIGGQTLNLDFDTGSADLWVFSTELPSSDIGSHDTFNPSSSSTWTLLSDTFELSYGDGSGASGVVGTDTVNIGGVTVTSQAVEAATSVSSQFVSDAASDGLVGLSFSSINSVTPNQQKTFFENVQGQLDQAVFTADLDTTGAGTYTFGEIDATYANSLVYAAIDSSSGYWEFTSEDYQIDGTTATRTNASPTIADTGTSLMLFDDEVVTAYYAKISSATYSSTQEGYVFDCDDTIPSFAIAIGSSGKFATVPGSGMSYASISETQCYGSLQSNSGNGLQIFGDTGLRSQFVVFDLGNTQIGFADKS